MKLVIPKQISVGPLKYSIVFSDYILGKMDVRASVNLREQVIRLPEKEVTSKARFMFLLHELDHIVNDLGGLRDVEEKEIEARVTLLAQALLSMGLEPDFSQIQKENP